MYLAQLSTFQTQAPFYIDILEGIISGRISSENKKNIDSAINEACQVAKGDKNIFAINNDNYFFITTLLANYKDSLLTIINGHKELNSKIYSEILTVLK